MNRPQRVQSRRLQPEELLRKLRTHTHYMPKAWRGHEHQAAVYSEVGSLPVRSLRLSQARARGRTCVHVKHTQNVHARTHARTHARHTAYARAPAQVAALFQNSLLLFATEIYGIIATPFILWLSLPRSAQAIVDLVRDLSVEMEGGGSVCGYALFDFAQFGNAR